MNLICKCMSLSGIKNLSKPITIDLVKNKVIKEDNKKRVLAIYGPNGSGKTAIVHAVEIFTNVLTQNSFLLDNANKKYVRNLINKNTREFEFSLEFRLQQDDKQGKIASRISDFSYQITLSADDDQSITIKEEKLLASTLATKRKTTRTYFHAINGSIVASTFSKSLLLKLENTIKRRSIAEVCYEIYNEEKKTPDVKNSIFCVKGKNTDDFSSFFPIMIAASKMNYFLLDTDTHKSYTNDFELLWEEHCHPRTDDDFKNMAMSFHDDTMIVRKMDFDSFSETIRRLTSFIKLFKPDLQDILIDKKENPDFYLVNLIFYYGTYQIHEDFESAGIRKLIHLFFAFQKLNHGDLLFIDELDSSINDVYLIHLVDYFLKFGNGQVIFTTHSVAPMDVLKTEKDAIAFINANGEWSYWKQIGGYSPGKLYKEGYIKGLPFNIHAVDFGSVLNDRK